MEVAQRQPSTSGSAKQLPAQDGHCAQRQPQPVRRTSGRDQGGDLGADQNQQRGQHEGGWDAWHAGSLHEKQRGVRLRPDLSFFVSVYQQ